MSRGIKKSLEPGRRGLATLIYRLQPADLRRVRMDVKCPACSHVFCESLRNMRADRLKACPRCGATMRFADDDLPKPLAQALRTLGDL